MSAVCQRTEQRTDRRSSVVTDLELVRVARMAKELVPDFEAGGTVRAAVEELDDVERWRRAARRAGRSLGWRIRTGVSAGWAWAVSEDWEPSPGAEREAALLISALIAPRAGRGLALARLAEDEAGDLVCRKGYPMPSS